MSSLALLSVILAILNGVFSESGVAQNVSVLEEDCFTLHTNVTEIDQVDLIIWMFGPQKFIIAKLNGKTQTMSLYDVDDGRFSERLQLDNQTGALTVCDARTKHSGHYELKIISSRTSYTTFSITVHDVFFAGVMRTSEGETVTLQTGVSDKHKFDVMVWTFGALRPDAFAAQLTGADGQVSYASDRGFAERLQMDARSGALSIRSSRSSDSGVYQLQVSSSRETFYRRYSLSVVAPESALSPGVVLTLVCVAALLAAGLAVGSYCSVKHCRRRYEPKRMVVSQGDSVTLNAGVTRLHGDVQMRWRFGPRRTVIAQMSTRNQEIQVSMNDERFRDRLQMNAQTGDLTIRDVRITHSGEYEVRSGRELTSRSFRLILCVDSLRFSEGDDVRLDPGVGKLEPDDRVSWSFGSEDAVIATIHGDDIDFPQSQKSDGRFRHRLRVDPQTGALIISKTKTIDSGVFHLQIKSKIRALFKNFRVNVWVKTVRVAAGNLANLESNLAELPADCTILWTQGENDTCIAKFNKSLNKMSEYRGDDLRFRDRLRMDPHTGSLSIFNVNSTHSDVYKLQVVSSAGTSEQRSALIVDETKVCVQEGSGADLRVDDLQISRDALVLWTFGPEDCLLAKADLQHGHMWTADEDRFTQRLEPEGHSASLSIAALTQADAGLYKLKVFSRSCSTQRRFRVAVTGTGETEINEDVPDQEGMPLIQTTRV